MKTFGQTVYFFHVVPHKLTGCLPCNKEQHFPCMWVTFSVGYKQICLEKCVEMCVGKCGEKCVEICVEKCV